MRHVLPTIVLACAWVLLVNQPAHAQADIRAIVVKHLTTSRDFTLKVAEQCRKPTTPSSSRHRR